jgi:kynureninase
MAATFRPTCTCSTAWIACSAGASTSLRVAPEEIEAALDSRCALVVLSHVDYRTSRLLDMN